MKGRSLAIAVAAVAAVAGAFALAGFRINTTSSLPRGLYITVDEPVQIGAVVLVCPPVSSATEEARARGYVGFSADCPERFQRLIKRVVGTPGMVVNIASDGRLAVDGREQANSLARTADGYGRPLSAFFSSSRTLAEGEYLVLGDTEKSFDGRYFGPVDRGAIRSVMRPVFTF